MAAQDNTPQNDDGLLQSERALFLAPTEQEASMQSLQPHINQLPVELLISLFKLVIDGKRNSTVIGTLLRVCRHWYAVVNNTASLWSIIVVRPTDFAREFPLVANFVSTAVEKSLDLPIEILFDFTRDPIIDFRGALEEDWLPTSQSSLDDLLLRIVGDKGDIMKRWRTFVLHIDYVLDIIPDFNKILVYPAPNLRKFQLRLNLSAEVLDPIHSMVGLSSLRTLILATKANPLDFVSSADSLQTLFFEAHGIGNLTATLEPFQNLRNLTLDFNWPPSMDHNQVQAVCLPRLECFTLVFDDIFYFPVDLIKMIEMPFLQTLRLFGHPALDQVLKALLYPHIHALHLLAKKSTSVYGESRRFRKTMMSSVLASRIQHYTALRNVIVAPWHLTATMDALRYLIVKGEAPVALGAITALIGDCDGRILADDTVFWKLMDPGKEMGDYVYVSHPVLLNSHPE